MTLRHLRIFIQVYQKRSMSQAANDLHLAQPAISLAISDLEKTYGTQLFDRISRKLYPTANGDLLYEYANKITSLVDEMELRIKGHDEIENIRIGSSITIGTQILPKLTKEFQKKHPQAQLSIVIKNTSAIEQAILNNNLDIALIEGVIHTPQINTIPFMKDKLILIASPLHYSSQPISFQELVKLPLLMREAGSAGRDIIENLFAYHQLQFNPIWESVSTQAIIQAVKQGLGVSILPKPLVNEYIEENELIQIPILDVDLHRDYLLIHHVNKFISPLLKEFIESCYEID